MTRQASIQLTETTERQARELAAFWELPAVRNLSAVVRRAIEIAYERETAGRKGARRAQSR